MPITPFVSSIAMNGLWRKRWQTNRDVFGSLRAGRAVLHPFILGSNKSLTSGNFEYAVSSTDVQPPAEDDSILIEVRSLARLHPASGAAHAGNAYLLSACIHPAHEFLDDLGLIPRSLYARGAFYSFGHTRLLRLHFLAYRQKSALTVRSICAGHRARKRKSGCALSLALVFFYRFPRLEGSDLPDVAPALAPLPSPGAAPMAIYGTRPGPKLSASLPFVPISTGNCKMKRMQLVGLIVLTALMFTVSNLAVGFDGEKYTNKQIMQKVNGPKGAFNDVKKGLGQATPDWPAITKQSKEIVTLTDALCINSPRKGEKASWDKLTMAYNKSAKELVEACEKMDLTAAKAAQQTLATACMPCHRVHK
jgi:hypothetical protein